MCQQQICARGDGEVLLNTLEDSRVAHKGSFARQNKIYVNITTIYVKCMG